MQFPGNDIDGGLGAEEKVGVEFSAVNLWTVIETVAVLVVMMLLAVLAVVAGTTPIVMLVQFGCFSYSMAPFPLSGPSSPSRCHFKSAILTTIANNRC
jgi:hypothetical protein